MTVDGGLEFVDAPEQVLLPLAVALLECLVAPAMFSLYLRVAAAVGCEDLARLPGFLGGRLPVEFLAGYPVDVGEVPAAGGAGTPGDLDLAEVLEMLKGHLDRGDAAGVDGVGDLPVGSFGQPVVIAEAERSLRPLVVSRKISGGTRSGQGTDTKMTLASLFGTWRAQGLNTLLTCRQLLSSPQL